MILLTEGTSWPGGLGQKRFSWLILPNTEAAIVDHLLYSLDADLGDHEAVLAWGEDAGNLTNCKSGIISYIAEPRWRIPSLDRLERLACDVSENRCEAVVLRIEQGGVLAAARSILEIVRLREPLIDVSGDKAWKLSSR